MASGVTPIAESSSAVIVFSPTDALTMNIALTSVAVAGRISGDKVPMKEYW